MEKSEKIFGNQMSASTIRSAKKSQQKFIRKYGDDRDAVYHLALADTPVIGEALGVKQFVLADEPCPALPARPLIVGNIRMGFGHYRISMAIASCAKALGYDPLWLDLKSFDTTTGGKVIENQNQLYSLGSRLSQKYGLFNKLFWEPLNSEGFRKISYNASDQMNAELMTPIFRDIPKDTPYVATHVWPAQAAVHAGMTRVINAIPDNWPMALHLAEGSIHTIQTRSAYLGYRTLHGMDPKQSLQPMPADSLIYTGHYVDHELVANLEADSRRRLDRLESGQPKRYLLTVGGAGAQKEIFSGVIRTLAPEVRAGRAAIFLNVGDHLTFWQEISREFADLGAVEHFENYAEASAFAANALDHPVSGFHVFYDPEIFGAVYITNLLMRCSDVLITKPSELAFYPVPKLFIKRVGGHEAWGAIHSAEIGDGTYECGTLRETTEMLRLFQEDPTILRFMTQQTLDAKKGGLYDGGYKVVELAAGK